MSNSASPHSPYQIRPGPESNARDDANKGPIVGWHGQEIDPSDHLPVDSWAPEPEKKVPTKTYGLGRSRDFGPRTADGGEQRNLSRDTKINVRMKPAQSPNSYAQEQPETSPTRNKLQKRPSASPGIEPLREHHNYNSIAAVPDPYAQGQDFSRGGFYGSPSDRGYAASQADALSREISSIDIGSSSGRHSRQGSGVKPPVAYVPVRSHRDRHTYY